MNLYSSVEAWRHGQTHALPRHLLLVFVLRGAADKLCKASLVPNGAIRHRSQRSVGDVGLAAFVHITDHTFYSFVVNFVYGGS